MNAKTAGAAGANRWAGRGTSPFMLGAALHRHEPPQRSQPPPGAAPSGTFAPHANARSAVPLPPDRQQPGLDAAGAKAQRAETATAVLGGHRQTDGENANTIASSSRGMGDREITLE